MLYGLRREGRVDYGKKEGTLDQNALHRLEGLIAETPWQSFDSIYGSPSEDSPRYEITYTADKQRKSIVYYRLEPKELRKIEIIIDSIIEDEKLNKLVDNKCPYCEQDFADAKKRHTQICKMQDGLKSSIIEQTKLQDEVSEEYQKQLSRFNELKSNCTFTLNQLNSIQISLDNNRKSLEQAKQAQNPFTCEQLFLETDGIEQNNIKILG